jgi:hypothetical protein
VLPRGAAIDEAADDQAAIAHIIPTWLLVRTALAGRLRLPRVRQCRRGVPEEPSGPRRATKYGQTRDNGISDSFETASYSVALVFRLDSFNKTIEYTRR